jgi:alpha-D-ribose 1-methylphosphonate 5-triphosphate synthase subunit PhnG
MGGRFVSLSTVESDAGLAQVERKIGRSWEQLSGMGGAQAASENVVLSDSLGYQALNARAAKVISQIRRSSSADVQDALGQRTQILEDSQTATKNAINKRRNVERLKGSSSINPSKVDDALHEMEDVSASRTTP